MRRLDKWLGIYQEGTEKILIQISQHVTEHFSSTWVHPPAASPWKRMQDPQGKLLPLEDIQVLSMSKPIGKPYSWIGRDHFDFHPMGTAHKQEPLNLWEFIHLYSFHSPQLRNQFKKSLQAPLTVLPGNLPPDLMRKDNNLSQILDAYYVPEMHQKLSNIKTNKFPVKSPSPTNIYQPSYCGTSQHLTQLTIPFLDHLLPVAFMNKTLLFLPTSHISLLSLYRLILLCWAQDTMPAS